MRKTGDNDDGGGRIIMHRRLFRPFMPPSAPNRQPEPVPQLPISAPYADFRTKPLTCSMPNSTPYSMTNALPHPTENPFPCPSHPQSRIEPDTVQFPQRLDSPSNLAVADLFPGK